MRFWGKIIGTKADYFIAEATLEGGGGEEGDGGEEETVEVGEPRGSGANTFVYFVTNSPLQPWVQLPDIKPTQINTARRIRQVFTGNINNKIYTNPFFFDTEKVYLRA
jgi:radial spoke head protein 4A